MNFINNIPLLRKLILKSILPLILILLSFLQAKSQTNPQIPIYYLFVSKDTYFKGAYYDTLGVKHEGYIWSSFTNPSIFEKNNSRPIKYKSDQKSDIVKLTMCDIRSFLIQEDSLTTDSFVMIHSTGNIDEINYAYDAIAVVFDKGPVKLFDAMVLKTSGFGAIFGRIGVGFSWTYFDHNYYYGADTKNLLPVTRAIFAELMSKIFYRDAQIVEGIKNKMYTYRYLTDLVGNYKADLARGRFKED